MGDSVLTPEATIEKYGFLVNIKLSRFRSRLPASIEKEDLKQSAILALLRASRTYQGLNGASFETYAYTRIYGSILDEIKRAKKGPSKYEGLETQEFIDNALSEDKGPYESLHEGKLLECLRKGLKVLPARDRVVIDLYYRYGFSMDEVAQVLGLTEGRISQIHKHVIHILKVEMYAWQ